MEMPRNDRSPENPQILVVGQDGMAIGGGTGEDSREIPVTEQVEQPTKVMRIGSMIKQLLEEVRAAPLDEASRARLKEIHRSSVKELEDGLAPELVEELERLSCPSRTRAFPATPNCASRRPSWWAGWRASSTGSRPRCSPSRWPRGPSWSRCGARFRRASATRWARTAPRPVARADRTCRTVGPEHDGHLDERARQPKLPGPSHAWNRRVRRAGCPSTRRAGSAACSSGRRRNRRPGTG